MTLLPKVQLTVVERLLREYSNQINYNVEMFENNDINADELHDLSLRVDRIYATKILISVLE